MPDREKIIEELQAMRDYHRSIGNNITADIADDAISMMKEQDERIKTLEHQLETITKWRANAGAFD